jgi:hypothetical protein
MRGGYTGARRNQTGYYIAVGDEVLINNGSDRVFSAIIQAEVPNYATTQPCHGRRQQEPSDYAYRAFVTGQFGSVRHDQITGIIRRYNGPRRQPTCPFSDFCSDTPTEVISEQRGVWCGSLWLLILRALVDVPLPAHMDQLVEPDQSQELYSNQRAGFLRSETDCGVTIIYVRAKPFRKWVKRNATRLCQTIAETRRIATREALPGTFTSSDGREMSLKGLIVPSQFCQEEGE